MTELMPEDFIYRPRPSPAWAMAQQHPGRWIKTEFSPKGIYSAVNRRKDQGGRWSGFVREGVAYIRWTPEISPKEKKA